MPSTTERKTELPPFKSRLQDWYERTRTANPEDTKKLLIEGYGLFFEILDPIAEDGKIDHNVSARFHLMDPRLKYFDKKFLAEKHALIGNVKVTNYHRNGFNEKQASVVFIDGDNVFNKKSITVNYNPRDFLSHPSPDGSMTIEENNVGWVRSGAEKVDTVHSKSFTELPPTKILGLALSLVHIYSEDRRK